MASVAPDRPLMTIGETASTLAISETTVRRLIGSGILPAKANSELFFDLSNLELVCRAHHEQRETSGLRRRQETGARPGASLDQCRRR